MDDRKLDELLSDAARSYRVPPEAPLDAIWARVEAEAFAPPAAARRPVPDWRTLAFALAASLVLGVLIGRVSVRGARGADVAAAGTPLAVSAAEASYQREAEELLGSTALLLAALSTQGSTGPAFAQLPEQATRLLTTTRLLLDSPVGRNPRMKALLQDLELVLAQVARLKSRRENVELPLITQTLEERDLVPRIRSAVTDLSAYDY
ncbi:MAG TPA: hypothetical protein VJL28_11730 [Gemmatimonadaceae bacterium]|nr:hypothetical protein [Gemmatimonadaceae bacterium]